MKILKIRLLKHFRIHIQLTLAEVWECFSSFSISRKDMNFYIYKSFNNVINHTKVENYVICARVGTDSLH